jgi:hypothetical protein
MQTPPPATPASPTTLWQFLGIPQACDKLQAAHLNKLGNSPDKEVKPPLKSLADPSNLQSPNPAIKKAAEVKQEEDLAPQKIKAIKYLATIACGCHPGVREALLAALDDCTEAVRYEAALAFCKSAGNHCAVCNKTSCCGAAVAKKLRDMADGMDDNGCLKEPSPRVRAAAAAALNACNMVTPLTTEPLTPVPEKSRSPIAPHPERATSNEPSPAPLPGDEPGSPNTQENGSGAQPPRRVPVRPVGLEEARPEGPDQSPAGIALAENGDNPSVDRLAALPGGRWIGAGPACPCPCPQAPGAATPGAEAPGAAAPGAPAPGAPAPGAQAPGAPAPGGPNAAAQPNAPSNALAGSLGAAEGPAAAAPNMMGDSGGLPAFVQVSPGRYATAPVAGGGRSFKISENDSPTPTDRVFFDYNHFQNGIQLGSGFASLDQFTFGVEKSLVDGLASVELRTPFAHGLSATQGPGTFGAEDYEFGNMALALKVPLQQCDNYTISAGLGVTLPTARDGSYIETGIPSTFTTGTYVIHNDSVHLMPFLGGQWDINDCWYVMGFAQLDFDANGDRISETAAAAPFGAGLTYNSRYFDQDLLYLDLGVGHWLYRDPCGRFLTGVVPSVELHYTTTLQDGYTVAEGQTGAAAVTNLTRQDILDLTAGVHFLFGPLTDLTIAGVAPLRRTIIPTDAAGDVVRANALFDAEVIVQLNRRF